MTTICTQQPAAPPRRMKAWLFRTDPRHALWILQELRKGRLRQGWGYQADQDIRVVEHILATTGRRGLSSDQLAVLPHRAMRNGPEPWRMQPRDLVLLPKLPGPGFFSIARITDGDYGFQIGPVDDHGHIRPAELLCEGVFNDALGTTSDLQRLLRYPGRLCDASALHEMLESFADRCAQGVAVVPGGRDARLDKLRAEVAHIRAESEAQLIERIRASVTPERISATVRDKDLELLVAEALKGLFPAAVVQRHAGRGDKGADISVRIPDPMAPDEPFLILVQVKDHDPAGPPTDAWAVEALAKAVETWPPEAVRLHSLIVVSLHDRFTDSARDAAEKLSSQHGVPVRLLDRKASARLIADGLAAGAGGPE